MRFDAQEVQQEMKRLERGHAQHAGDPGLVPMELVAARLVGMPDELAERVGLSMETEIVRTARELLPTYERLGLEQSFENALAVAFLQGVTWKAAIGELQANTIDGTTSE